MDEKCEKCSFLAGRLCNAVVSRENPCSNKTKNLCCYLCQNRKSCEISCDYLGKSEGVAAKESIMNKENVEERIILEDKKAILTTETLTIKGETFKISQIKNAWAEKGFFNACLKILLTNGEEKEFKRFISEPASLTLSAISGDTGGAMAFLYSRLDMWASSINSQIENQKLRDQKTEVLMPLTCSRCGANLNATLKCSHCGLQHRTS